MHGYSTHVEMYCYARGIHPNVSSVGTKRKRPGQKHSAERKRPGQKHSAAPAASSNAVPEAPSAAPAPDTCARQTSGRWMIRHGEVHAASTSTDFKAPAESDTRGSFLVDETGEFPNAHTN